MVFEAFLAVKSLAQKGIKARLINSTLFGR